jgi:hypothetical protein
MVVERGLPLPEGEKRRQDQQNQAEQRGSAQRRHRGAPLRMKATLL